MTSDLTTLVHAYRLAAQAHAHQRRKNRTDTPYINHCCEVAELVAEAGAPAEMIVAAVLHDVVEDSDITADEIAAEFGPAVATLVQALTNPPEWDGLPRLEMKRRQAEHMRGAPAEVRRIKIADQTSNVRDIAREPDSWDAEAEYLAGAELVVDACRGVDARLEAAFDAALAEAMAKIGGTT